MSNCFDQSWSGLNFWLNDDRTAKKEKQTNWDSMCHENVGMHCPKYFPFNE